MKFAGYGVSVALVGSDVTYENLLIPNILMLKNTEVSPIKMLIPAFCSLEDFFEIICKFVHFTLLTASLFIFPNLIISLWLSSIRK